MTIDNITDEMVVAWFKAKAAKYGDGASVGFSTDYHKRFVVNKEGITEFADTPDEAFNIAKKKFAASAIKWGFKQ